MQIYWGVGTSFACMAASNHDKYGKGVTTSFEDWLLGKQLESSGRSTHTLHMERATGVCHSRSTVGGEQGWPSAAQVYHANNHPVCSVYTTTPQFRSAWGRARRWQNSGWLLKGLVSPHTLTIPAGSTVTIRYAQRTHWLVFRDTPSF